MSQRDANSSTTQGVPPAKSISTKLGTCFLAAASGSLDVIAFLTLGQVFASAQTGNTALLGISISDGDWSAVAQPAIALLGFAIGAAAASLATEPNATLARQSQIIRRLILFEVACLAIFATIWQLTGDAKPTATHSWLILLCSFSMGLQGVAAKIVHAPGVNTIVFTITVVEIMSSITNIVLGRHDNPQLRSETIHQISGFSAYASGALIAGLLAWSKFPLLAWLPVVAVLIAFVCFEVARGRRSVL